MHLLVVKHLQRYLMSSKLYINNSYIKKIFNWIFFRYIKMIPAFCWTWTIVIVFLHSFIQPIISVLTFLKGTLFTGTVKNSILIFYFIIIWVFFLKGYCNIISWIKNTKSSQKWLYSYWWFIFNEYNCIRRFNECNAINVFKIKTNKRWSNWELVSLFYIFYLNLDYWF